MGEICTRDGILKKLGCSLAGQASFCLCVVKKKGRVLCAKTNVNGHDVNMIVKDVKNGFFSFAFADVFGITEDIRDSVAAYLQLENNNMLRGHYWIEDNSVGFTNFIPLGEGDSMDMDHFANESLIPLRVMWGTFDKLAEVIDVLTSDNEYEIVG